MIPRRNLQPPRRLRPPPEQSPQAPLTGDPLPNVVGDPAPGQTLQFLWIEAESLLPLRWEVSKRGVVTYGFNFTYESIDLQTAAGVGAPECIR